MCSTEWGKAPKKNERRIFMKTKGIKRIIAGIAAVVLTLQIFCIAAFAEATESAGYPVSPQSIVASECNVNPKLSGSGLLSVTVSYNKVGNEFYYCDMVTYVERKNLGLIWGRVDIGTTDNEWLHRAYPKTFSITYETKLKKTGTYRVTTEFTFTSVSKESESVTKRTTIVYD